MGGWLGFLFEVIMWIYPNSTVQFFRNIPLSPSYTDTLLFDSLSAQSVFFDVQPDKITIANNYYQRSGRNSIKVEAKIGDMINFNYMRFKNTSHSNKWFYCFIDGEPQYINENTVQIFYIIDVMQTYAFDYNLLECYVEREHTSTDVIGENLEKEPVDIGEYVCLERELTGLFQPENLAILVGVGWRNDSE